MKKIFIFSLFLLRGFSLMAEENFNPMLYTNTDVVPVKIDLEEMRAKYPQIFDYEPFLKGYLWIDSWTKPLESIEEREGLYRESYGEHSFLRYIVDLSGTNYAMHGVSNHYLKMFYETDEGPIFLANCNSGGDYSNIYSIALMSNIMVLPHSETIGFMLYNYRYSTGKGWEGLYHSSYTTLMETDNKDWDRLNEVEEFVGDEHYADVYYLTDERLEELRIAKETYKTNNEIANSHFYEYKGGVDGVFAPKNPDIHITASRPLFDKTNPFRYTIQNAFDQNPATSYVENTEDDLMEVELHFSNGDYLYTKYGGDIIKGRLINGYAENERLYSQNNRIKVIYDEVLDDNELGYQYTIYPIHKYKTVLGIPLKIHGIYKGSKYSDTCLAELDFQFPNKLWLFGGFDE